MAIIAFLVYHIQPSSRRVWGTDAHNPLSWLHSIGSFQLAFLNWLLSVREKLG